MERRGWLVTGGCLGCGGLTVGAVALGTAALGVAVWVVGTQWEAALQATLDELTDSEVVLGSVQPHLDGATLRDVRILASDGDPLLEVDRVRLEFNPFELDTESLWVRRVEVEGVHAWLRLGPGGFALPDATLGLVAGTGVESTADLPPLPEVFVQRVSVVGIDARATAESGEVTATVADVAVEDVSVVLSEDGLALEWELVSVGAVDVLDDGDPLVSVAAVRLTEDHVVEVEGVALAAALRRDGYPVLPPVVYELAPTWAGGAAPAVTRDGPELPWFGVDLSVLPWLPDHVVVTDTRVTAYDPAWPVEPKTWHVSVPELTAGPLDSDLLPVQLTAHVAGGWAAVSASLRSDGQLAATVHGEELEAVAVEPYLRGELARFQVALAGGRADADLQASARGTWFTASGTATVTELALEGSEGSQGHLASAATSAVDLVGGRSESITLPFQLEGDLADPDFRPVPALISQTASGLVGGLDLGGLQDQGTEALDQGTEAINQGARDLGEGLRGLGNSLGIGGRRR